MSILNKIWDRFVYALTGKTDTRWRASEQGNVTRIYKGLRLTIFEDRTYGGIKYCIAEDKPNSQPFYSEQRYGSHKEALKACLREVHAEW